MRKPGLPFTVPRVLLRQSVVMTVGLGLRMVAQGVLFLWGAQILGATQFGLFAGVQAFFLLVMPFAHFGSGYILLKHLSRGTRPFAVSWGSALTLSVGLGLGWLLFMVGVLAHVYSPQVALRVALPLGLGEIWGQSLVLVASQAFQARRHFRATAAVWALLSLARLAWVLPLGWQSAPVAVEAWATRYGLGGLLAGVLAATWATRAYGRPRWGLQGMRGEWRQGLAFATNNAALNAHNHLDKALLSMLATRRITGVYTIAYRLLDAAFLPVQGLIFVLAPRLFARGHRGVRHAAGWGARFVPVVVAWGLAVWALVGWFSPWLARWLGPEYAVLPAYLRVLGGIVALRGVHAVAASILAGADHQPWRTAGQIATAGLNLALNVAWIPRWGWLGAAYSSLASELALALLLWSIIGWHARTRAP